MGCRFYDTLEENQLPCLAGSHQLPSQVVQTRQSAGSISWVRRRLPDPAGQTDLVVDS